MSQRFQLGRVRSEQTVRFEPQEAPEFCAFSHRAEIEAPAESPAFIEELESAMQEIVGMPAPVRRHEDLPIPDEEIDAGLVQLMKSID